VKPRFGHSWGNWYLPSAEWLIGGMPEPAKCMSYFPVLIKTEHIKKMREHIEKVHQKEMQFVFQVTQTATQTYHNLTRNCNPGMGK
jgi:2,4-dienoyl-CoA reductase-like NADH-dependent reductase (Old Yellow Enzyme family)